MKIRISQGVGSNPKLWAVLTTADGWSRQVGEFDLDDRPGFYYYADGHVTGCGGMTGIVWCPFNRIGEGLVWPSPLGPIGLAPRRTYESVTEWIADVISYWPRAEIIDEHDQPLDGKF